MQHGGHIVAQEIDADSCSVFFANSLPRLSRCQMGIYAIRGAFPPGCSCKILSLELENVARFPNSLPCGRGSVKYIASNACQRVGMYMHTCKFAFVAVTVTLRQVFA
jgi:hypothetical protein